MELYDARGSAVHSVCQDLTSSTDKLWWASLLTVSVLVSFSVWLL